MHLRVPFLEGRLLGLDGSRRLRPARHIRAAASPTSTARRFSCSHRGPLRPGEGPRDLAPLRERMHRRRHQPDRDASRRPPLYRRSATDLWADWSRSRRTATRCRRKKPTRRGLTTARRLTYRRALAARDAAASRLLPRRNSLIYHRENNTQRPAYVRLDLATGVSQPLAPAYGGGPASPTPDGRGLVFQRLNFIPLRLAHRGRRPHQLDRHLSPRPRRRLVRPLTRGFRAHEPDVSPDGTQVVCVAGGEKQRQLAIVPIDGGAPRVLAPDAPGFAYTPAFSPDGRQIAYSR